MADEEVKQEELPLAEQPVEPSVEAAADEAPVEVAAEETPAEVKPEPAPEPEKPDWRDKELKSKHRQIQEERRKAAEAIKRAEAAEALAAKFNQAPPGNGYTEPLIPQSEVDKLADQKIAERQLVEEGNRAVNTGKKIYGQEWDRAIANLELKQVLDQPTISAILKTSKKFGEAAPAKILYELGQNPDLADQLMSMSYEERILEMADMAKPSQARPVSNAPAPVSTVGGRAAPAAATLSDDMPDDKWFATRRAQRLKAYKEKHL